MSESLTLASSQIQALYTQLPPSLRSHISSAISVLQRNISHQEDKPSATIFSRATTLITSAEYTTLLAVFGPVFLLLYSMSNWWPTSGRYSPFAAYSRGGPPRVTEDDYSYLPGEDDRRKPRNETYGAPHQSRHGGRSETADLGPDILILRHKGVTYPLHFPAFSIAEGELKVRDLRRLAAKETKTDDPRRVKLLYKGRSLRNDTRACKEEGLKQNSELMCVVSSDSPRDDGNESSSSASSSMIANGLDAPRADVDGQMLDREPRKRKNHRGGKKKKDKDSPRDSPRESGFLAPPNGGGGTSSNSRSTSPLRHPPSPAPPSTPKKPQTPSEMLNSIAANFHNTFLPQCQKFVSHPPTDTKTRDFEYKKLSESILAQVLLKLDAVETEGDGELRTRRRELVRETQGWLTDLDRLGKR